MTEGNTLLGDEKLEKLVILRMNRKFMEFMRKHYCHLIKDQLDQQFGHSGCFAIVSFPDGSRSVPVPFP